MNEKSSSKIVLVTGGNRGIGFAVCQGLLAKGCEVILAARDEKKAEDASKRLKAPQGRLRILPLDVADDVSIDRAARRLSADIPRLDVLINNAGIFPDEKAKSSILNIRRDLLKQSFDTNTFGPIMLTQALLPLLKKSSDARVINMSSGLGQLGGLSQNTPSYCLSKLTLNGVTIMQHQALQEQGVAVFVMCPGWVKTDMGGSQAPRTPEQGADTAIWLATEAPRSLSGKFFRDRNEISW